MNQTENSGTGLVERYLTDTMKASPVVVKRISGKLHRHPDIEKELCGWISTGAYPEDAVAVQGYTAQQLAALPGGPQGFAAYTFLVTLREKPEEALQDIRNGFAVK